MDILVTKENKVCIVDVGARMGGNLIGSHIIPIATGIDYMGNIIRASLNESVKFERKLHDVVATRLMDFKPGIVKNVPDLTKFMEDTDVKDIVCNNEMEKDYINSLSNRGEEVWDSLTETYRRDSDKIIPYAQQFKHNKYFNEQEATSARMEYLKEQEQKQHHHTSVTTKTAVPHTEAKPIRGKSNPELYTRFIGSIMGLKNAAQELKAREGKAAYASLSLSGPEHF